MVSRRPRGWGTGREQRASAAACTRGDSLWDSSDSATAAPEHSSPFSCQEIARVLTSRGGQISSTKPGQVLSAARFYCAYQHVWNGGNHFYMLKNSDSFFLPKPTT